MIARSESSDEKVIAGRTKKNGNSSGTTRFSCRGKRWTVTLLLLRSRNPRSCGTRAATRRNPPQDPCYLQRDKGCATVLKKLLGPVASATPMQHQSQTGILIGTACHFGTPQQAQRNGGTGRSLTTPAHETSKQPGITVVPDRLLTTPTSHPMIKSVQDAF
jgi:hypothetical protein